MKAPSSVVGIGYAGRGRGHERCEAPVAGHTADVTENGRTTLIQDRLDLRRIALGAGIGLALGSALGALSIRRGSRLAAGVIAGIAAYVLVVAPVLVITDDVALAEDLNAGGLGFLALLLLAFSVFAFLGATVGGFIASFTHGARMQKRHQH